MNRGCKPLLHRDRGYKPLLQGWMGGVMDRETKPVAGEDQPAEEGVVEVPASHAVMFWFLLLLAFSVFAPCVLLPAWMRYGEIARQEQVMTARVGAMKSAQEQQMRTIQALRTDPAVNERVALRELRYRRPGEAMVAVEGNGGKEETLQAVEPIKVEVAVKSPEPPEPIARLSRHVADWPLQAVFCESPNREVSLTMSIGLMVVAFWLYAMPRRVGK
jgi:hypothetical protein